MEKETKIIDLIKQNIYFFAPYTAFLLVGLVFLIIFPKGEIFLGINGNAFPLADKFFFYVTTLGDGIFIGICLIPLAFISVRYAFLTLIAYLTSGGAAQLIKRISDLPRPKGYFADTSVIHFVQGLNVSSHHSFPSGHTASAFSLFLLLGFITKNKKFGLLYFALAFAVALSRVYLAEHFFMDIYVGSVLGVAFTIFVYYYFESRFNKIDWMRKPLLKNFKNKS